MGIELHKFGRDPHYPIDFWGHSEGTVHFVEVKGGRDYGCLYLNFRKAYALWRHVAAAPMGHAWFIKVTDGEPAWLVDVNALTADTVRVIGRPRAGTNDMEPVMVINYRNPAVRACA